MTGPLVIFFGVGKHVILISQSSETEWLLKSYTTVTMLKIREGRFFKRGRRLTLIFLSEGGRSIKTAAKGGQEQRQNFRKIPQPPAIVNDRSLTNEDFGR